MNILRRLFGEDGGGSGSSEQTPEAVAQAIVARYRQGCAAGHFRVDDQLLLDLSQVLPGKEAWDVFDRFRTRRSRSDLKAEYLLLMDIGVALHDAEHFARNFKPILVGRKPEMPDRTPPSAANTYAKVMAGRPLTSADEDAVLFGDLLNDE